MANSSPTRWLTGAVVRGCCGHGGSRSVAAALLEPSCPEPLVGARGGWTAAARRSHDRCSMASGSSSARYAEQIEDDLLAGSQLGTGEESHQTLLASTPEKPKKMRGAKKRNQNPEENVADDDNAQKPEKKRKGGRQREENTAEGCSSGYETVPGETQEDRNRRTQRITRRWARKWYAYEELTERYAMRFAFTQPWSDLVSLGVAEEGQRERPAPPPDAHETSLRTPANYPAEVEKRKKNAERRGKQKAKKEAAKERNDWPS